MKMINRMLVIALVLFIAHSGLKAAQKDEGWATDVKAAAKLILSNSPKHEEVDRNLALLIDTANKIAARDARLPAEFRAKLQAAAKAFAKNPLSLESSEALSAAYKIVNGGKAFAFPDGVGSIGEVSRLAQQHIGQGVKAFESGQSDQAVRGILTFVLLVTTPVMK